MDTILVTGGTRGLGLAICRRLAKAGYKVVAVGRKPSGELTAAIQEVGAGHLIYEPFDLSKLDAIAGFASELQARHGVFYGLVNNAATGLDGVLATQHEKDIVKLVQTNLLSPILLTKYVTRYMMLKRRGRVVNVSSIIASTGFNGLSVYAATKAGLIGFTKSQARELGKIGITVNALAPGYMETAMTSGLGGDKLKSILHRSPLGKLASADEVAAAAAFFFTAEAAAITGTTLTVDAGSTA